MNGPYQFREIEDLGDVTRPPSTSIHLTDGVLIGNEVVEFLKKKKKKAFLLKIDFEKAYDSRNWSFIRNSMIQMDFGDRWCNWIEASFKSTRISVLVNGSPTD